MKIIHKRGDTFVAECIRKNDDDVAMDITSTIITSQVKAGRTELPQMTVTKTVPSAGAFTLVAEAADTLLWPLGTVEWDIQYQDGDIVASVPSNKNIIITVIEGATDAD